MVWGTPSLVADACGMSTQWRHPRRVSCSNDHNGREYFELAHAGTNIRITTPGALTRTRWNREQAQQLRDALSALLNETARR